MLTGALRYRQACQKARMIGSRQLREYMDGRRDWLECTGDMQRDFIIREIDRAFEAGRACAMSSAYGGDEK